MNLEKLKDTARKLEQKEDWRKAIEVYLKAIQQAESGAETTPDLSLYNRVGDLYLKINDTAEAVRSYERAVDLYADQGFFNNAIALCGKILRVNPGRTQTYLKLSQLHARKNVVIEAKRNLIEFLERMNALGQLDQAFQAVKLFADQFSGSQEIRSMLVELLRASSREDEAREQLERMAEDLEAMGDKAGARKARERLSSAAESPEHVAAPEPAKPAARSRSDLIFLDTGADLSSSPPARSGSAPPLRPSPPAPSPPAPIPTIDEPIETETLLDEIAASASSPPIDDLIIEPLVTDEGRDDGLSSTLDLDSPLEIQRQEPPDLTYEGTPLEGIQGTSFGEYSPDLGASSLDLPQDIIVSFPDNEIVLDVPPEPASSPDPSAAMENPLDRGRPLPRVEDEPPGTLTLAELEDRVLDDPENPDVHLAMANGLVAAGETTRVQEEVELALAGYEDREDWVRAAQMADRLVELAPDSVTHHQKRVELAYRAGDRAPLLDAYLGLGEALAKSGALDKAIAVYGRVIEHDPTHASAAAALARLGAPVPGAAPQKPSASPAPAPPLRTPTPAAKTPSPSPKAAPVPPPKAAPPPAAASSPPPKPPTPSPARRPAPAASGDFVDLGSMVFEDENRRDTRMRVNRLEPQDQDEQREFQEILEQFKRGIDQNLDSDDYEAHYDLGVAFKEMGLLDEAIAEFQKALRSPEGRLRTSEALGLAFFEKGQHAACEAVLRRAVDSVPGGDDTKIGLLYWLGRASEALGKDADAVGSYERAMVVDISFMDLSKRVQRLSSARRK